MSGFDIILMVALAAFMVNGFTKGLMAKILSLAALVLGILVSARYGRELAQLIMHYTGFGETFCGMIGIAAIFITLFVVASLLSKALKKVAILQIWDRLGGALFGLLEGGLLLSLLLLFLAIFDIPAQGPALEKSFMYEPVKGFAPSLYRIFVAGQTTEKFLNKFFLLSPKQPASKSK